MMTRAIAVATVACSLILGSVSPAASAERLAPRGEPAAAPAPVADSSARAVTLDPIDFEPDDSFPTSQDSPVSVAIGDVTDDGRPDLLATTEDGILNLFAQGAEGSLADPVARTTTTAPFSGTYGLDVGDLDGDGDLDAAVSLPEGVDWFEQDGGTLLPAVHLASTAYGTQIAIDDLDGDGLGDIVSAGDSVEIWLNSGTGFTDSTLTGITLREIEVGDVTGDDVPDVVTSYSDRIAVYPGVGDGTFDDPARYRTSASASAIALGDGNDDGRTDVMAAVGGNADSKMNFFRQTTAGELAPRVVYESKDIPDNADVADMNGDGRDDLVVGHGVWVTFGIYLQRADGTFAPETLYPTDYHNYEAKGLATGDLNDDGKPDVVFADFTGEIHAWRQAREVRIDAPRKVRFGQDVPWTATLVDPETTTNTTLSVYEVVDGIPHLLLTDEVDADGTLAGVFQNAKRNVVLRVEWDGDGRSGFAADTTKVAVAVIATGALKGAYAKSGGYHLYHDGDVPVYVGKVKPVHQGVGLEFRLQRKTAAGWATVTAARVKMNADGQSAVSVQGLRAGIAYRVRCEFDADEDHAGDVAPWAYLRVK